MSNLERDTSETRCGGTGVATAVPTHEVLEPREVPLGGPRALVVRRTLPHRDRRMVGAWCFVDDYGPADVTAGPGMQVPPHPHTGLQTVSWLLEGEILHRDSVGSLQRVRPGELNLMTAGGAISHSEESPAERPAGLRGVQLWVALPDVDRHVDPHFEHHPDLPRVVDRDVAATVVFGELAGHVSPATTYTPIVGADVELGPRADTVLPLDPDFEHAVLGLSGSPEVDGVPVEQGTLLYLGTGRRDLALGAGDDAGRFMLLGGAPFEEELLMWWNFVGRSHDEIVQAREDWESGDRFGTVVGYPGERLPAPPLPGTPLRPRPRVPRR
ncbi:MAG TPA: pirin family protein [Jiangellales bacterium]|nr:pirin family protein [Jiangellales bacterium]